jgi:xanthine dehydrogenase accessory factor
MRRELLELASDLVRRGEPFALATVVARQAPVSAQVGDTALVKRDGTFFGWVGGSCTRPTVIDQALKSLEDNRPRLVALDRDPQARRRPGLEVFAMTCHSGGSVEIHIQPVVPPPALLIYGISPTARALAQLGHAMGYRVIAVDPTADDSAFAGADVVATDPADPRIDAGRVHAACAPLFAVVATQGEWDESATVSALSRAPAYLGVMASPRRFAELRAWLSDHAPGADLARIKSPAGLDLGATQPEEIALSILAEIVKERRASAQEAAAPGSVVPAPAALEARDPVCGMTVAIQGAAHRAEHEGTTFYFCCGGCKARFVAAPERYLAGDRTP